MNFSVVIAGSQPDHPKDSKSLRTEVWDSVRKQKGRRAKKDVCTRVHTHTY